ncbi:putative peptidylprolyl isomerase [Helianthus annuus]|uniref:peptidylprolyl isomerase n=1 Tax=Helianthus annuus TaxID=4232 RepID=A0A251U5T5_HELAN|nr:putative peptidylprolyl isomerase [Helianthus annuus]KAJ0901409.1 putative peptidylprolyl isomerase [Helianthus annuus]
MLLLLQRAFSLPLVDVHYEGSLAETGEVFDTTHEDNTIFTFQLGKGPVIKAWDVAFRTMKDFFYLAAQVSNPPHISVSKTDQRTSLWPPQHQPIKLVNISVQLYL